MIVKITQIVIVSVTWRNYVFPLINNEWWDQKTISDYEKYESWHLDELHKE